MGEDSGGNGRKWVLAIRRSILRAPRLEMSAARSLALILVSAVLVGLVAWWGAWDAEAETGLSAAPQEGFEQALMPPVPGPEPAESLVQGEAREATVPRGELKPRAPSRATAARAGWPRLTIADPVGAPIEGVGASWCYSRERAAEEAGAATRLITSWTMLGGGARSSPC